MRHLVFILIVSILLSSCTQSKNTQSVSSADYISTPYNEPNTQAVPSSFKYGRSFLSQDSQNLYDWMIQKAENFDLDDSFIITDQITEDSIWNVANYFWGDNPLYYWVIPYIYTDENISVVKIKTIYDLDISEIKLMQTEIQMSAQDILSNINKNTMDSITYIHDILVTTISYDQSLSAPYSGNIYGALVKKNAVCDGFTKTFQYLSSLAGYDNIFIQGKTPKGLNHSWNMICIDSKWYCVDTTWDSYFAQNGIIREYLCVTSSQFDIEHIRDPNQYPNVPQNEDSTYNYHVYNGMSISIDDEEILPDIFAKQIISQTNSENNLNEITLDIKIVGSTDEYAHIKSNIIQNAMSIIENTNKKLMDLKHGYSINLDTSPIFSSNDGVQVVYLYISK